MTVTKDQAQMLASLAIACRPAGARRWDSAGTMAAIAKVANRNLASVVIATINAAADRDVETPGVIPAPGSHWQSAGQVQVVAAEDPTAARCTICGGVEHRGHSDIGDHHFSRPKPPTDPETVAAHVAALKAQLAPTSGPTERRTLADLAEANPELHARVEAVRAANPGLAAPPMREAAVPIAHPDATEPDESEESA